MLCIFVLGAIFTEIWTSRRFFSVETLSLGWRICAQGWRMSAQGWRQVSYQLKTGSVPVFSQNKKQKTVVSVPTVRYSNMSEMYHHCEIQQPKLWRQYQSCKPSKMLQGRL